jgi:hypothetical protein
MRRRDPDPAEVRAPYPDHYHHHYHHHCRCHRHDIDSLRLSSILLACSPRQEPRLIAQASKPTRTFLAASPVPNANSNPGFPTLRSLRLYPTAQAAQTARTGPAPVPAPVPLGTARPSAHQVGFTGKDGISSRPTRGSLGPRRATRRRFTRPS